MIKRVKDKLRDRGGVTILMALFAMLVASMVCVVILSAATTAAHEAKNSQEFEQTSLSLLSAAKMVAGELYNADQAKSFKISYSVTETTAKDGSTTTSTSSPVSEGSFILKDELCSSVESIINTPNEDAKSGTYTISASARSDEHGIDYSQDVNVSYVLRHGNHTGNDSTLDYQLIFTFTANAGTAEEQSLYLKMQGKRDSSTSTNDNKSTTTTKYTFSWSEPRYYTAVEGA